MNWLVDSIDSLAREGLLREPRQIVPRDATHATVDGREAVVFCGNDYLGLRYDPRLTASAQPFEPVGAGASRLVSGNLPVHEHAERALARWVGQPAALMFTSGYAANVGAISALAGAEDAIFSDSLNHASIVDGCRLSRARVCVYRHGDVDDLARALSTLGPTRRRWIITESLFSMDGDLAPLDALHDLAESHGAHLYVDEAHALGVIGPRGGGVLAELGLDADVTVGTLGKAIGTGGAFVAGGHALRTWLWNRARSFVFSTGLPPVIAAASLRGVEIVETDPEPRRRLVGNIQRLREGLAGHGRIVTSHPASPIVPVIVGDERAAVALSKMLLDDGWFVQAIRPPTVPKGTARLRVTVSAAHEPHEIDGFVRALARHLPA